MTLLDPVVLAQPLSAAMREGSASQHDQTENSGYMTELMSGRINEEGYAALLLRLRPVYAALEETGRTLADDPVVAAVLDPALERLPSIEADLAHWAPGAPDVESPAVTAYVDRIRAAAAEWAPLFVAHHYTRYLGDLSGGQAIGKILGRTYGLDGVGLSFYAFDAIEKPKVYKDGYRAALDAAPVDDAGKARIVEEVQSAFHLNKAVFDEIGADMERYRR